MHFFYVLASTVFVLSGVFNQAGQLVEERIEFPVSNITVKVTIDPQLKHAGTGGPGTWCTINDTLYPSSLGYCPGMPHISVTFPTTTPSLGTVLHEIGHGLGIFYSPGTSFYNLVVNNSIGHVKIRDSHIDNKRSVMWPFENDIDYLDDDTLYVLKQLGYRLKPIPSSAHVLLPSLSGALSCVAWLLV